MTLSDEEKKALLDARLRAARESLADAKRSLDAESLRGAMNRSYYAMFHAAAALAISRGVAHRKHSHLIGFFQKEYAKPEIIARQHGRAFQKAFEDRSEADYQDYVKFDAHQVAIRIQEADAFIQAISAHLGV